MSDEVKAHAEVAEATAEAHGAPTRLEVEGSEGYAVEAEARGPARIAVEGYGPKGAATRKLVRRGRPRGSTLDDPEVLREAIREMRREAMRVSQENVEKYSGITRGLIRGLLRREKVSWSEFLASF